jgi:glycine cleavage system H lipoate-binding protein
MAKKQTEYQLAEKVLDIMFDNEEVEGFVAALNEDPEVKAWLLKLLPKEGEQ